MHVGLSTPTIVQADWSHLLHSLGHVPLVSPPLQRPSHSVDLWVVVLDHQPNPDTASYRFWLRSLGAPTAVITPRARTQVREIAPYVPTLRVIAHTSRAIADLPHVLALTAGITHGTAVLYRFGTRTL